MAAGERLHSGPGHFASMTPIRHPHVVRTRDTADICRAMGNPTTLWTGIACSPCVNAYNNRQLVCRNNLCMQALTVEDVYKEVTRIYDSLKTTRSGM
jgi:hypothetical protein